HVTIHRAQALQPVDRMAFRQPASIPLWSEFQLLQWMSREQRRQYPRRAMRPVQRHAAAKLRLRLCCRGGASRVR
ncbi:MAG: hypothetical protein LC114_03870, partial [Bryobacterales bacterium]|nr:hypothetical protein [Bryobacterales bacterium]